MAESADSSSAFPNGERVSRRGFLKSLGVTAVGTAGSGASTIAQQVREADREMPQGPGAVPIKLKVNGKTVSLNLEPRVTLLDALRYSAEMTGTKEGCDRASCGACTVLLDGEPVYACMMLAIDARDQAITTIEGIGKPDHLSAIQQAFVEADATQCGFCTPGFVLSCHALLERNPHPSRADIVKACSGNICRCGTQPHVIHAVQQAAGIRNAPEPEVIRLDHEELA